MSSQARFDIAVTESATGPSGESREDSGARTMNAAQAGGAASASGLRSRPLPADDGHDGHRRLPNSWMPGVDPLLRH